MSKKTEIIRTGILTALIAFSAVAALAVVLAPGSRITTLAHALPQLGGSSVNTNFIKYETFNGHFSLEVPESWNVFDNADGSVLFCNDTDCHNASETLQLYSFDISPGESSDKIFNDILQQERDSNNLVITQPPQRVSDSLQKIVFKGHDPISGQDFVGIGIHSIAHNHLYVADFISLPEEYQTFAPIMKRISSTWHTHDIIDGGSNSASSNAFDIQSKILHDRDCANKNLVSNMNVNPTHERFDAGCGMWMNAP
jgi:hypothetical protein